jgi:hypothetical protein
MKNTEKINECAKRKNKQKILITMHTGDCSTFQVIRCWLLTTETPVQTAVISWEIRGLRSGAPVNFSPILALLSITAQLVHTNLSRHLEGVHPVVLV